MSAHTHGNLLFDNVTSRFSSYAPMKEFLQRVKQREFPLTLRGPKSSFASYLITRLYREHRYPLLIIVPQESEISPLAADLELFGVASIPFPSLGTGAYSEPSLHSPVWGERMRALVALELGEPAVVIASQRAVSLGSAGSSVLSHIISLETGKEIDPQAVGSLLVKMGYLRVPKVNVHGEFALRGEVLDVFLPGWENPVRVVFDFDTISRIRVFSTETQASIETIRAVKLFSCNEITATPEDIAHQAELIATWPEVRGVDVTPESLASNLLHWAIALQRGDGARTSSGDGASSRSGDGARASSGDGARTSLAGPPSLLQRLAPSVVPIWLDRDRCRVVHEKVQREYEMTFAAEHFTRALPRPDRVILSQTSLEAAFTGKSLSIEPMEDTTDHSALRFRCDPARSFFGNVTFLKEELTTLTESGSTVVVLADTDAQRKRIDFLLSDLDVQVLPGSISAGFGLPDQKLVVIQENEIFGRRRRPPASVKKSESSPLDTFLELEEGDHVVHVNYGIGQFRGIRRLAAAGHERDYIELVYADDEVVFIPIEQVNLIQRYIGSGGAAPRLDRIGGKSWEKRKSTVRKNVEDLAERLVKLYARRAKAQGFAFPPDTEWQMEFEAAFPWEETRDQLRCIAEVKADMERPQPMDRLICGDVGYGKTEVALRAAFKALTSGKQVAFLAPTTILAEQHYELLQERLQGFPVKIGMLSRFVPASEQKAVLKALAAGEIDAVVGTHRLLQKDVSFRDLGLMIVDEEQRFGVKDKERLKEFKHNIDCLTMTATPIPRTLHMSLMKVRDMSLLSTPPQNRHPIETVIGEFNEETIVAAIRKEIQRGGQVFFLHNRVETLENIQRFIEQLMPEVLVETAHGQMGPLQLEDIMHRFIKGAFQVLVATTIIENGIDIPNVNTIIIDRADMYGISQLYQLRGRVGRSDRVAYAYLFHPEKRALSELAMKRLEIISDFTELGSGFKIALKDLEVRGAGNLLGSQQSGDILSVGFDLYLKLLDEAVRNREQTATTEEEVYLELEYSGFIPDTYITEQMEKMEVYKKIASVQDDTQLDELVGEVEDRFGPMPEEVQSLLALSELRILARRLHLSSIRERRGLARVEFGSVASVSVERVLSLIQRSQGAVRLDPDHPNVLMVETGSVGLKEKSEFIRERLLQLL